MPIVSTNFGSGGQGLTPNDSQGTPDLATILRGLIDDIANNGGVVPAWTTGITVTANVAVLAAAGRIIAVESTTGGITGPNAQVQNGTPGSGEVDVQYDGGGIATLTFAAADTVTGCAVVLQPYTAPTVTKS